MSRSRAHCSAGHPPGTKAYFALLLFLLLGQRISDIARIGQPHIGKPEHVGPLVRKVGIGVRQHKNCRTKPVDQVIPILPQFETALAGSTVADLAFLGTARERPFVRGLAIWFEKQCIEASVPGRAQGLRKAGAIIAAENGATAHQLMAIFGWKIQQAVVYTEKPRQHLLAGGALNLLTFADGGN